MRTASLAKLLPALFSGLLLALANPPGNLFMLVFVGLVPWLYSIRNKTLRESLIEGAWLGVFYFGYQMSWLLPFVGKWTGSIPLASLPWMVTIILQIPYFVLLAWLVHHAYARKLPWMVPFAWAAVESIRAFVPVLAFPHGILAIPLWVTPILTQSAAFGMIFLVSAWIVLVNVTVVEIAYKAPPRATAQLAIAVIAIALFSIARYMEPRSGTPHTIAIGQLGTDMAFGDPQTEPSRIRDSVTRIFAEAATQSPELLVLSEGLTEGGTTLPPATPFELPPPMPTLFGGHRAGAAGKSYQSCYGYLGQDVSPQWKVVNKSRLVIFGEFVPFRDQLPFLKNFRLPTGDLVPGDKVETIEIAGIKAGPMICFEALFPDVALKQCQNGANLLVVPSNDDWFVGTLMSDDLLAATAFRSVECGLPTARAASMGWTAAFDARGNLQGRLPIGANESMRVTMMIPEHSDGFAFRWLFPWIAGLLAFGNAIYGTIVSRTKTKPESPT